MPLAWIALAVYLGYHTLHGDRGLYALWRQKAELHDLQTKLAQTRAERERMELKVSHLRDGSLDRDLLDEQLRRTMGMMRKDELLVMSPSS